MGCQNSKSTQHGIAVKKTGGNLAIKIAQNSVKQQQINNNSNNQNNSQLENRQKSNNNTINWSSSNKKNCDSKNSRYNCHKVTNIQSCTPSEYYNVVNNHDIKEYTDASFEMEDEEYNCTFGSVFIEEDEVEYRMDYATQRQIDQEEVVVSQINQGDQINNNSKANNQNADININTNTNINCQNQNQNQKQNQQIQNSNNQQQQVQTQIQNQKQNQNLQNMLSMQEQQDQNSENISIINRECDISYQSENNDSIVIPKFGIWDSHKGQSISQSHQIKSDSEEHKNNSKFRNSMSILDVLEKRMKNVQK